MNTVSHREGQPNSPEVLKVHQLNSRLLKLHPAQETLTHLSASPIRVTGFVRMIALKDTGQNLRIGPNVIRRLLCAPLLR